MRGALYPRWRACAPALRWALSLRIPPSRRATPVAWTAASWAASTWQWPSSSRYRGFCCGDPTHWPQVGGPACPDRALLRVAVCAHRPGLPGRGLHRAVAATGCGRSPRHRLAGQPDAHTAVYPANPHRRFDTDVEPGGRGRVLHRVARHRAAHAKGAGRVAGSAPDGGGSGEPRLVVHSLSPARRHQSVDVAARLLLLVRRRDAAGRMERGSALLGAASGPSAGAAGRGGSQRLRGRGVASGWPGGPDPGAAAPVRRQDRDGRDAGLGPVDAADP